MAKRDQNWQREKFERQKKVRQKKREARFSIEWGATPTFEPKPPLNLTLYSTVTYTGGIMRYWISDEDRLMNEKASQLFCFLNIFYRETGFLNRTDNWIPSWINPSIAEGIIRELRNMGSLNARTEFARCAGLPRAEQIRIAKPMAQILLGPLLGEMGVFPDAPAASAEFICDQPNWLEPTRQISFED